MSPAISVVVPVRDEADNIDPLIAEICAALAGEDFEIVYVDDGSRDGTAERLRAALSRYPKLRVVTHKTAAGQSAALRTGVAAARARWVVTLDGDGQNDPADIEKLLAIARQPGAGALGMVAGIRGERRDRLVKRLSSRIANAVRMRLLGDATPDTGCGLKAFRRETYLALPRFDHMHRFLPALIQREGLEVALCPVSHRPRRAGRTKYGVPDRLFAGLVDLIGVLWLKHRGKRADIVEPEDS
ncbi:MAG: glycosyltransferase family 2 protein [Pseudomonadota bacterium]